MYDDSILRVELTCDEVELIANLLLSHFDKCISYGEESIVMGLLEKINKSGPPA